MSSFTTAARSRLPRLAEAATTRARLALVPARSSGARRTPFVALVLALLAVGMVGLLVFNTVMQQHAFRATALQHRADALQAQQQSLSMEVRHLRDPQNLAVRARSLGMVSPPSPAFLRLPDGKVLGDPEVATPEGALHVRGFPAVRPADLAPRRVVVRVPAKQHAAGGAAEKAKRTDKAENARHHRGQDRGVAAGSGHNRDRNAGQ